jgi:signal transduction histidine kinase
MMLKRWLPQSLFGRIVLLMTVGLVAAQLVSAAIHLSERYRLMTGIISQELAQQTTAIYKTLNTQPVNVRTELAQSLSTQRVKLSIQTSPPSMAQVNGSQFEFENKLRQNLGSDLDIRMYQLPELGHFVFDVYLPLSDGQWLRMQGQPPQDVFGEPWHAFMGLGFMLLVIVILVVYVARVTVRPLTGLARAAHDMAVDLNHPPLLEEGPIEVQEAVRAFNTMQKRVREGIEERERFLAAVSHDLKTPLTRLRLRAEMLPNQQVRDDIQRDVAEMQILIDETLDFLRGRAVDEPLQQIDLVALVESVVDDVWHSDRVSVQVPDALRFKGRPMALKRALSNLLENAIKYGDQAHIVLKNHKDRVVFSVEDGGQGIPDDKLEAVFEPFFRLEDSRNRDTGGSGLGLAIVRLVAQSHGGEVVLSNLPQGGLRAELILPRT